MRLDPLFIAASVLFGAAFGKQDDVDTRFELFLEQSMQNFSSWIIAHNLDPTEPETVTLQFRGNDGFLYIIGETVNRTYSGISDNIGSISVKSDLRGSHAFYINFTHGSSSDVHSGDYFIEEAEINSTTPIPINGQGSFEQSKRILDPNDPPQQTTFDNLYVDEGGYLQFLTMGSRYTAPKFEAIRVEGLDAGEYAELIKDFMNSKINTQAGNVALHSAIKDYIQELLDATRIEDIIGEPIKIQKKIVKGI